jgi:hypothetical protein
VVGVVATQGGEPFVRLALNLGAAAQQRSTTPIPAASSGFARSMSIICES